MSNPEVRLATIVSASFQENAYVAHLEGRSDGLVVDPGMEPEKIIEHLQRQQVTPVAILITHGHADHIAGNEAIKRRWPECRLIIGIGDAPKLTDTWANLSAPFGFPVTSPEADATVEDGQTVSVAGFDLEVLAIPGHSIGHVVYLWRGHDPMWAFVGDVIFAGSVGRTDFPDGDFEQLAQGIRAKLFVLPDDTVLFSGHGLPTTVGREKRSNPFVGE